MKPLSVAWMKRLFKSGNKTKRQFTVNSPYESANWLERIFFFYTYPLFVKSIKHRGLELTDVPKCPKDDESERFTLQVMKYWHDECLRTENNPDDVPRFWLAMLKTFGPHCILPVLCLMINECFLTVVQPLLLGRVINYFNGRDSITYQSACLSAAGILVILIAMIMLLHNIMIFMDRTAMRARSVCCTIIYIKSLKLSRSALQQTEVGQIINMMSNDVKRFDDFGFFSSYLIVAPIQMIIIVIILFNYLEIAMIPGTLMLVLLIPFQYLMGRFFCNVRRKASILTDIRLRYMSEIISGMRVLKMYTWEGAFAKRIIDSRAAEIAKIRISCILKGINLSVFFVASRVILFVCFVTFVLMGNTLTSEIVFVTMAWFNQIRLTMTLFFPNAVSLLGELNVTFTKITNFLLLPEVEDQLRSETEDNHLALPESEDDKKNNLENNLNNNNDEEADVEIEKCLPLIPVPEDRPKPCHVIIDNISATWNPNNCSMTLNNISADLRTGDLLAVVGPVGAGKSSLLMALLNELPLTSGQIDISGSLSYAGQDAWNFNASIRENILFGLPMDFRRYQVTVKVCALERDFELLPNRDQTLVGERGVSLSGGQRARINLARAIYRKADCYLLDDPLSALDASVSKFIFEKCLLEHLSDKICILVTHQIQFVERATKILVLKHGKCEAYGTFTELRDMGINFIELLKEDEEGGGGNGNGGGSKQETGTLSELDTIPEPSFNRAQSAWSLETVSTECMVTPQIPIDDNYLNDEPAVHSTLATLALKHNPEKIDPEKGTAAAAAANSNNETDHFLPEVAERTGNGTLPQETIEKGELKWSVYWEYLKAGSGIFLFTLMILSTIISQIVCQGTDIFVTIWTNGQTNNLEQGHVIGLYSALILALFISTIVRAISFFDICMRASRNLHTNIFGRLIATPIRFFETNPLGRILNRFSKDLGSIDENFPYVAFDLNVVILSAIGIIIAAAYVSIYFLIPGIIYLAIVLKIRSIYIVSALDVKRFEAFARSPIYSHQSTTVSGLCSIRAFGEEETFVRAFFAHINDHSSTWFLYITSSRGLGMFVDLCCVVFNAVIIVVLMSFPVDKIPGGNAGLAISSGLALTGMIQWGVRQSAEFVSQMSSVERIVEYKKLEQEATPRLDKENEEIAKSKQWPKIGRIVFDHMCLSYHGRPPSGNESSSVRNVLENITVTFEGSTRIGIVGRTGAGKSSIINALFRLNEAHSGRILIDNIDIQTITHTTLRKKLSIIPQEPEIFSGTVRYNLDPFDEYDDSELWNALDRSQLRQTVENMPGRLEAPLNEHGSNLSVGQRQLMCLARAILRHSKILILDEATANVDPTTDQTIQENIRTHFMDSTVLTIAHRLSTIIDYHKILVLDAGMVQEFDTPYNLLSRKGAFHRMCMNGGEELFKQLYQSARKQHLLRFAKQK